MLKFTRLSEFLRVLGFWDAVVRAGVGADFLPSAGMAPWYGGFSLLAIVGHFRLIRPRE